MGSHSITCHPADVKFPLCKSFLSRVSNMKVHIETLNITYTALGNNEQDDKCTVRIILHYTVKLVLLVVVVVHG